MKSFKNIDTDNSQSIQFSQYQSQLVSTETCHQIINQNIEDLKKLHKSRKMFDKIYETLNHITIENDFNAMNFAAKENFCNVKKNDQTIFEHSIRMHNIQLARYIIEFGGQSNYNGATLNDSNFARFILKTQHFDVNQALMWASRFGHHEIVKLLLSVPGIDINAKDSENWTALMKASLVGQHKVVKLLLAVLGIDINTKDNENKTALHYASINGHHKVVKLLLTVPGIDVNAKDNYSNTALHYASINGLHKVVKLLLTVPGIDVNAILRKNKQKLIL